MDKSEIVKAYKNRTSLKKISAASSLTIPHIRKILVSEGVEIRGKGRISGTKQGTRISDKDQSKMAKLYKKGFTMEEIAVDYGISRQRVHQILLAIGTTSRRRGPRSN